jgi:hypothetical protein
MKLSEFILELQKLERADPDKDIRFYMRYRAAGAEATDEVMLLKVEPRAVTFTNHIPSLSTLT